MPSMNSSTQHFINKNLAFSSNDLNSALGQFSPAPVQNSLHYIIQQQQQQKQQPLVQQVLEKSNRLSDEGRRLVIQFFTNQLNPTTGLKVYKTELHEKNLVEPETQQIVKETYYIELDYNTFGYLITKKK